MLAPRIAKFCGSRAHITPNGDVDSSRIPPVGVIKFPPLQAPALNPSETSSQGHHGVQ